MKDHYEPIDRGKYDYVFRSLNHPIAKKDLRICWEIWNLYSITSKHRDKCRALKYT